MKQEHLESVIVGLLAVNQYRLDKAWALLPGLRTQGMASPDTTPEDEGEATVRLADAGYDRGLLTAMFAGRVQNLMAAVRDESLAGFGELVESGRKAEAIKLLCTVKGIGPRAAENAWLLINSPEVPPAG